MVVKNPLKRPAWLKLCWHSPLDLPEFPATFTFRDVSEPSIFFESHVNDWIFRNFPPAMPWAICEPEQLKDVIASSWTWMVGQDGHEGFEGFS